MIYCEVTLPEVGDSYHHVITLVNTQIACFCKIWLGQIY